MEVWDGYREDGTLAGCDVVRGDVIPAGIFYIVSEVKKKIVSFTGGLVVG